MSYYVIGIGGTGARCMESFVHLCAAGILNTEADINFINVDADVSCGNLTKTQQLVNRYSEARKLGFGDTGLFKNFLKRNELLNPVAKKAINLNEIFEGTNLDVKKEYHSIGCLYKALFTEQERTTPLKQGFRGHPAIGAAAINDNINREEKWDELISEIMKDGSARIFIFASIFGGTGAAGFPTIARRLKDKIGNDKYIGGALVLPYFDFPNPSGEAVNEMQAYSRAFFINTKTALDYYDKSGIIGNVFKSVYMVGDNKLSKVKNFSLGSEDQKNEANFIELYAALAAVDFFNKSDDELKNMDFSVPMIARTPDDNDHVTWQDFPKVGSNISFKSKFARFILTLYMYKHYIYPALETCEKDPKRQYDYSWYVDLVKKGGIDVHQDSEANTSFKKLAEYTDVFFEWLHEIVSNEYRNIELVPDECFKDNIYLEPNKVILPTDERTDKLTKNKFVQNLCDEVDNRKPKNGNGTDVLMDTIYNICTCK